MATSFCTASEVKTKTRSSPIGWVRQNAAPQKIRPKPLDDIFCRFPIGGSWLRHILCGYRLGWHGCKMWWFKVKQWPNYSTLWRAGPVLATFIQYKITIWSRSEVASDVISCTFVWPVVPDQDDKLDDPGFNSSQDIPPEDIGGGIFHSFSR